MRAIRVARKLDNLAGGQVEEVLEALTNLQEDLLALLEGATLAAGHVAVAPAWNALTGGPGPDADTVEGLANIDDHAHYFAVVLILELLADGSEQDLEPELINVDAILVLELVGPFAAVLVLNVFPLGPDAHFEKVVVGLLLELGNGSDVVLNDESETRNRHWASCEGATRWCDGIPERPKTLPQNQW